MNISGSIIVPHSCAKEQVVRCIFVIGTWGVAALGVTYGGQELHDAPTPQLRQEHAPWRGLDPDRAPAGGRPDTTTLVKPDR